MEEIETSVIRFSNVSSLGTFLPGSEVVADPSLGL